MPGQGVHDKMRVFLAGVVGAVWAVGVASGVQLFATSSFAAGLTTSPSIAATSNGVVAGRHGWPVFHGGFTHAGESRAV